MCKIADLYKQYNILADKHNASELKYPPDFDALATNRLLAIYKRDRKLYIWQLPYDFDWEYDVLPEHTAVLVKICEALKALLDSREHIPHLRKVRK